jgi:hypothetical protein
MTDAIVLAIKPWLSDARFEACRSKGESDTDVLVTYLYNVALCEALYTPLSFLGSRIEKQLAHRP